MNKVPQPQTDKQWHFGGWKTYFHNCIIVFPPAAYNSNTLILAKFDLLEAFRSCEFLFFVLKIPTRIK